MPVRVLVVDDSTFFQHRLKDIINEHPDLKVIGIAANGQEAVEKAAQLKPDIITMDFEMPLMDGVTAVKHIMASRKTPILMFSSLTYEGARITLDALAAGALDFIPKDFAEVSRSSAALKKRLHERLITLAGTAVPPSLSSSAPQLSAAMRAGPQPLAERSPARTATSSTLGQVKAAKVAPTAAQSSNVRSTTPVPHRASNTDGPVVQGEGARLKTRPRVVVIGASTGGPVALAEVLLALPADFPLPIVLVQHMPENFTKAFAERLNRQCRVRVREATDGEALEPGLALLAPGGKQLMLDKRNGGVVRVLPDDDRVTYKPCLDITFGSAANSFGDKVLGIVLTGMGSDGCKGAQLLKQAGSALWSQDEASSVIYGMPMAVARAGLSDRVLSLKDIGPCLTRELMP